MGSYPSILLSDSLLKIWFCQRNNELFAKRGLNPGNNNLHTVLSSSYGYSQSEFRRCAGPSGPVFCPIFARAGERSWGAEKLSEQCVKNCTHLCFNWYILRYKTVKIVIKYSNYTIISIEVYGTLIALRTKQFWGARCLYDKPFKKLGGKVEYLLWRHIRFKRTLGPLGTEGFLCENFIFHRHNGLSIRRVLHRTRLW
jgi:hypothetical protein